MNVLSMRQEWVKIIPPEPVLHTTFDKTPERKLAIELYGVTEAIIINFEQYALKLMILCRL